MIKHLSCIMKSTMVVNGVTGNKVPCKNILVVNQVPLMCLIFIDVLQYITLSGGKNSEI